MSFFLKILSTIFLFALLSCTHNSDIQINRNDYGGTLKLNEHGDIKSLFPHSYNDIVSFHVISQIYDGLVRYNSYDLSISPAIASSWEIDSTETQYTFHLKNNVYFHNNDCFDNGIGRKVVASDFVFTYNLLATKCDSNFNFFGTIDNIEGATEHYYNNKLKINGISAKNDTTLVLKLVKPYPLMLYCLASPAAAVIPKEGFIKYGYSNFVGCGPFYINKNNKSEIVLIRNGRYFMKDDNEHFLPYLDTVKFSFNYSKYTELDLLKNGKLDLLFNIEDAEVSQFLEQNISMFKGNKPKFVLQVSNLSNNVQLQHILKRNISGFITNSQNYFDLSKVYYSKE